MMKKGSRITAIQHVNGVVAKLTKPLAGEFRLDDNQSDRDAKLVDSEADVEMSICKIFQKSGVWNKVPQPRNHDRVGIVVADSAEPPEPPHTLLLAIKDSPPDASVRGATSPSDASSVSSPGVAPPPGSGIVAAPPSKKMRMTTKSS